MLIMGLPVLATMGMMGVGLWIVLIICLIPLGFGVILQLILTAVTERPGLLIIPAGLGLLGLLLTLLLLIPKIPVWILGIYWTVYFLFIWLTWLAVRQIKKWIARRRQGSV